MKRAWLSGCVIIERARIEGIAYSIANMQTRKDSKLHFFLSRYRSLNSLGDLLTTVLELRCAGWSPN